MEVVPELDRILAEHRLQPVAVLLTHGHIDHTFSVTPVCSARDIPAYIHPDDDVLLADPMKAFSAQTAQLFGGGCSGPSPATCADARRRGAGAGRDADHRRPRPGHTPGSVMFRLPETDADGSAYDICLSGDVLFAGSIGRTDLPGGDHAQMLESLRTKVLTLADRTVVLPGHGDRTTIARERASNPFLQDLRGAARPGPSRGL
jgi:glyoxylase-like metal-dependent hydrolase (beta-lactamase superfamily II)